MIDPNALDRFTESADVLNLSAFDVTEVRRASGSSSRERQRLYRGRAFVLDLVGRLKVDITVLDDAAMPIAQLLIESVQPESIDVLRLEHAVVVTDEASLRPTHVTHIPMRQASVAR